MAKLIKTLYDVFPLEIIHEISTYLFEPNDDESYPYMTNHDGYALVGAFPYCFPSFFPRIGYVYLQHLSEKKENRLQDINAEYETTENIYSQCPQFVLLTDIVYHSHPRIYNFTFERIAFPEKIERRNLLNKSNIYHHSTTPRFDNQIQYFKFFGVHKYSMRCLEEMEEDNDLMDFVRETFDEKYEFIASGINALDAYLRDELEVDEEKTELEVLSRVRLFRLLYNP